MEQDKEEVERFRVIDGRDWIHVFADGCKVTTQYQTEIGEDITLDFKSKQLDLAILV